MSVQRFLCCVAFYVPDSSTVSLGGGFLFVCWCLGGPCVCVCWGGGGGLFRALEGGGDPS